MAEREEKIKREVKTDEYGNVRKEEVKREVDTKSEAKQDMEDAGDKMKAGAKAMGAKIQIGIWVPSTKRRKQKKD